MVLWSLRLVSVSPPWSHVVLPQGAARQTLSIPIAAQMSKESFGASHVALGEGDGTPPQYSCLENPMDGGA